MPKSIFPLVNAIFSTMKCGAGGWVGGGNPPSSDGWGPLYYTPLHTGPHGRGAAKEHPSGLFPMEHDLKSKGAEPPPLESRPPQHEQSADHRQPSVDHMPQALTNGCPPNVAFGSQPSAARLKLVGASWLRGQTTGPGIPVCGACDSNSLRKRRTEEIGKSQGCIRREGTSETAPEAVR